MATTEPTTAELITYVKLPHSRYQAMLDELVERGRQLDQQALLIRRQSETIQRLADRRVDTLHTLADLVEYVRDNDFTTANGDPSAVYLKAVRAAVAGGVLDRTFLEELEP